MTETDLKTHLRKEIKKGFPKLKEIVTRLKTGKEIQTSLEIKTVIGMGLKKEIHLPMDSMIQIVRDSKTRLNSQTMKDLVICLAKDLNLVID